MNGIEILALSLANALIFFIGTLYGRKLALRETTKSEEKQQYVRRNKPLQSGGIRHITPQEKTFEQLHGEEKRRFESLIEE
jgi:hypothetical protein